MRISSKHSYLLCYKFVWRFILCLICVQIFKQWYLSRIFWYSISTKCNRFLPKTININHLYPIFGIKWVWNWFNSKTKNGMSNSVHDPNILKESSYIDNNKDVTNNKNLENFQLIFISLFLSKEFYNPTFQLIWVFTKYIFFKKYDNPFQYTQWYWYCDMITASFLIFCIKCQR